MNGCTAADNAPIDLLVPYSSRVGDRSGLVAHRGRLDPADVEEVDGLRTVVVELALADLLTRGSRRSALACADQVLARVPAEAHAGFLDWVGMRIDERVDPRGRRQAHALLGLATGLPESPAESWTLLELVDGGLPPPVPQFPVTDLAGRVVYRLDFAWPDLRIAVEYDGYAAHLDRRGRDARRDEDLRRRGWIVIRADATDLHDPSRLIAGVRAAFARRGFAA
ncbi:DUF559 domain-containing protein [Amycolatopsis suaedae]|uniref:DUF559 domain-containing protein n=1 Tax=Amycolatopsis suaedae TaxID=2510978 RepID=A0A4Q7J9S3_9PSEU|nr:DUF559 domain-containing protein [Amycolatopsis suaedae]